MKAILHRAPILAIVLVLISRAIGYGEDTIVINITKDLKYIRDGETSQTPVQIVVGQKVRWINKDDQVQHTATSRVNGPSGKPVFDSTYLQSNNSFEMTFDEAAFLAAGGKGNSPLTVEYYCRVHPTMMSSRLVLSQGPIASPPAGSAPPNRGPTPTAPTNAITINATGGNVFDAATKADIKAGDIIQWKLTGGFHGFGFTNWTRDRGLVDILGGLAFDSTKGETTAATGTVGDDLMRIQIKAIPENTAPLEYFCTQHRTSMLGKLVFGPDTIINPPTAPPYDAPQHSPPKYAAMASFDDVQVTDQIPDSYFALSSDFNLDGKPDLATSGLGLPGQIPGEVAWYENPKWTRHLIAKLDVPVALAVADIDEDGLPDLAVTYKYGGCIFNCNMKDGAVGWLKNPGTTTDDTWKFYPIGNLMASHRLNFGHFSKKDGLELLVAPVVGGAIGHIHDRINTTIFARPDNLFTGNDWPSTVINDKLRVIHDVTIGKFPNPDGTASRLDSILFASEEGITWVFSDKSRKWQSVPLGSGETGQIGFSPNKFQGSNSVEIVKTNDDPFAYMAAVEPFHGNILAVYTKETEGSLSKVTWKRQVIDIFGPPDYPTGQSPGHHVIAYDVDNDGKQEFLVGLRGPAPYEGVYLYRPIDLKAGTFSRQRLSFFSAARIVLDDFDSDGVLDFATTPYRVRSYFETKDPRVMVYYNRTKQVRGPQPQGSQ